MTPVRGQARPRGRDPRISGDPILSARSYVGLLALVLAVQGFVVGGTPVRADEVPQVRPHLVTISADSSREAGRDSLLREIEINMGLIRQLRDSLTTDAVDRDLDEVQRLRFERSIDDVSEVIEHIGVELSRLELEIHDNTISLVDERGDGIIIRIPENLDETLSEGFQAVTEMVLEGLPDTLMSDRVPRDWSWSRFGIPKSDEPTRVIEGNLVRVWDDALVAREEDVRGSVVVVMGDAEIQGRVDGNVVVVLGNLRLADRAEVTGSIVTVGGRYDRGEDAKAGDEIVLDLFGGPRGISTLLTERGGGTFLVCQGLFVLMLVVALLAAVGAPEHRFRRVTGTLVANPAAAAGVGVLVTFVVHLGAVVLAAILVLTVVGLPLALLLAAALVVAGVIATAIVAAALGERICAHRGGCPSRALAVTVGLVVLHLPAFLGSLVGMVEGLGGVAGVISLLGAGIKILAYLLGIGALTMSRFGTSEPAPGTAPEPVSTGSGNT